MSFPACSGRQRCELKKGCLEAGNKYQQMKAAEQSIISLPEGSAAPPVAFQRTGATFISTVAGITLGAASSSTALEGQRRRPWLCLGPRPTGPRGVLSQRHR